jgi:hypothetical protein
MFGQIVDAVGEDRTGWSNAALSARLLELLEAKQELDAEVIRLTGQWDAAGAWAEDGALSARSWLAHHTATTKADAALLVRSARLVQQNRRTAKALAAGDISPAHVEVAARAARTVEDLYADHEDGIVDAALVTNPEQFKAVVNHWRNLAESIVDHEPPDRRFDRRYLHISPVLDRMARIDGYLDAEAAARLVATLDALEPPDAKDGPTPPRTLAQRRADALVRLAIGEFPAVRTSMDVVVDLDTLMGRIPTDLTSARCEIVGFGPIDRDTAVRLACDAAVGRVIMRGASEVLDVGRRSRVATMAQRRALNVRDRHCVEPGCDVPAAWCDVHHRVPWFDGGATDLDNLELRCRRHHIAEHESQRAPPQHLAAA